MVLEKMRVAAGRKRTDRIRAFPWVVTRNDELSCMSTMASVRGEDAAAIDTMVISEIAIQFSHAAMIGIRNHDCRATSFRPLNGCREPHLISPGKQIGVVLHKVIVVVHHGVGGVDKHKVVRHGLVDRDFEVGVVDRSATETNCDSLKIIPRVR